MARPRLMAIGDSLFNGFRSLTIDATRARWSAPSQLAKGLGITDFAIPDYPSNVIINFENWVRKVYDIPYILRDISSNFELWKRGPKSRLAEFDNIAIGATTYDDMLNRTWRKAQDEIEQIEGSIRDGKSTLIQNLSCLFFAYNTRFVLNPQNDQHALPESSVDIVARRSPERLIVSIGHNNGMWKMAFSALACPGVGKEDEFFGQADLDSLDALLDRLVYLTQHNLVDNVYIDALPHSSCAPALMPIPDNVTNNKPGAGKYYAKYENRFGLDNYHTLSGQEVKHNDDIIDAINERVRTRTKNSPIHMVPIDKFLSAYDWKTNDASKTYVAPDGRVISNMMFDPCWNEAEEKWDWAGGLCGLDGMHPSLVGYNIMAQTILDTIVSVEGHGVVAHGGALPKIADALSADTLLQSPPSTWCDALEVWLNIRKFESGQDNFLRAPMATNMQQMTSNVAYLMSLSKLKTGSRACPGLS